MKGKCHKCGDQEFRVASDKIFRLAVPQLTSLLVRDVQYACPLCNEVRSWSTGLIDVGSNRLPNPVPSLMDNAAVERKRLSTVNIFPGNRIVAFDCPSVFRDGEDVLFPTSEGTIQDATVVDRFGKPDLMTDFADEYLRQFWILMPTGRLPNSLVELMPALLLLVTATELALKAYWIRSGRPPSRSHSLLDLYRDLDLEHQEEIERRLAASSPNSALSVVGAEALKVADVLRTYSQTYGSGSNVYMDARYYAEPTTMFPQRSGLHGDNLVKGGTPYPVFLPALVRVLVDTYRYFAGPERLMRLGADLLEGVRDSGNDNHGEWGLIPSSLGLVVVSVPQRVGIDAKGEDLKVYEAFKMSHPTDFCADWMYGGNTLLFYRDGGREFSDGKQVIDGLECRVWCNGRLGMHSRELNWLADTLEAEGPGQRRLGELLLPSTGIE